MDAPNANTTAALLQMAEPLVLDIVAWFRRRQAETGTAPSDAEVIARVKSKVAAIVADGEHALQDFPEDAT